LRASLAHLLALATKESSHAEKAFGFSESTIKELNRQPGVGPLPKRQFALLLIGLAALLVLLYVQIVW
jgi:hypothetical protein